MYIDELRWFVVLAETGHMTDAAAKLNVSQPTLSPIN
jgi:LysR family transcriptional regulator, transcription activator of glutamate synthase operon